MCRKCFTHSLSPPTHSSHSLFTLPFVASEHTHTYTMQCVHKVHWDVCVCMRGPSSLLMSLAFSSIFMRTCVVFHRQPLQHIRKMCTLFKGIRERERESSWATFIICCHGCLCRLIIEKYGDLTKIAVLTISWSNDFLAWTNALPIVNISGNLWK